MFKSNYDWLSILWIDLSGDFLIGELDESRLRANPNTHEYDVIVSQNNNGSDKSDWIKYIYMSKLKQSSNFWSSYTSSSQSVVSKELLQID